MKMSTLNKIIVVVKVSTMQEIVQAKVSHAKTRIGEVKGNKTMRNEIRTCTHIACARFECRKFGKSERKNQATPTDKNSKAYSRPQRELAVVEREEHSHSRTPGLSHSLAAPLRCKLLEFGETCKSDYWKLRQHSTPFIANNAITFWPDERGAVDRSKCLLAFCTLFTIRRVFERDMHNA